MRRIIAVCLFALVWSGCSTIPGHSARPNLLPTLEPYVKEVVAELSLVPVDRRVMLEAIAADIMARLKVGKPAHLTFICTHNSRRSHMSQIWAQTAACYYGLDRVQAFSGGTQATACNCRTVAAMRRVGFDIEDATAGENPLYLVRYATGRPPIHAYSKLYNADANPKRDFIALMTCSQADKTCPVVEGAIARYAIHYVDPRICDDTPTETAAYNERCREIAREMFYIMSEVRRLQPATTLNPSIATLSTLVPARKQHAMTGVRPKSRLTGQSEHKPGRPDENAPRQAAFPGRGMEEPAPVAAKPGLRPLPNQAPKQRPIQIRVGAF